MPSFGGVNIFGRSVSFTPEEHERAEQRIAFPGVSGIASKDHGYRGTRITVKGLLVGVDSAAIVAAESLAASYKDAYARTLVEVSGRVWLYTKLVTFAPQGRYMLDPYYGYVRPYMMVFEVLK